MEINRRKFLALGSAFALIGAASCSQKEEEPAAPLYQPQAPFQSFTHHSGRMSDPAKPQLVIFSMAWDSPLCGPDRMALANVLQQLDPATRSNMNVTMIVPDYTAQGRTQTENIAAFLATIPEGEVITSSPQSVYARARQDSISYVNFMGMMGNQNWQDPPVSHTRAFLLLDAQGNRLGTYFSDLLQPAEIVRKIKTDLSRSVPVTPELER